jgi:hypothetical protein
MRRGRTEPTLDDLLDDPILDVLLARRTETMPGTSSLLDFVHLPNDRCPKIKARPKAQEIKTPGVQCIEATG